MSKTIVNDEVFSCEVHDEVAIVQLKNRAMSIAIDFESRDKYLDMLDEIAADPNVSGLILLNTEAFPGENEVQTFLSRIIEDSRFRDVIADRLANTLSRIVSRRLNFPKPMVTGVAGPVTMEEFGAYLMSDRLIAADNFSVRNIGLPAGLPPGPLVTFLLPRILGPKTAFNLLTRNDPIKAPEALDIGLIDKIAPEGQVEQECRAELKNLAGVSSAVITATRQLIFSEFDNFQDHLDRSIRQQKRIILSAEHR